MPARALTLLAVIVVGLLSLGLLWLLGMRDKDSVVVTAQRRINRAVINPNALKTAGSPGAYASVIRHTGRTSGRQYETPVGAVPTEGGFVIGLMYGSQSDWLKNVLASGSATIVHEGVTHPVDRPEVLAWEAAAQLFPEEERRSFRLFGVRECLRVRDVEAA